VLALLFLSIDAKEIPKGFVLLKDEVPNIKLEMRYFGKNNFIGRPIKGYLNNRAILTIEATEAIKEVQKELNVFGLGLKIFDAYRPQKGVDDFVSWGMDLNDTLMKSEYYPNVQKKNLFKEGYIAKKSSHSRGSTLDLTIIDLKSNIELDMGSSFDFFGKCSWIRYSKITAKQKANRMLLNVVMLKHGFKEYTQEWWHFTLKDEPYPDKYFDFDI
jgi:D-alanyl-D-alanine dipeptidase